MFLEAYFGRIYCIFFNQGFYSTFSLNRGMLCKNDDMVLNFRENINSCIQIKKIIIVIIYNNYIEIDAIRFKYVYFA